MNAVNDYVEYTVNVPQAGTYSLAVMDCRANNKGTYQLAVGGVNQGGTVDQYNITAPPTSAKRS